MYLADSNIFLEVLLDQDRASEAKGFLEDTARGDLHVTDFSIYSIGIILTREGEAEAFRALVQDVEASMTLVRATFDQLATIPHRAAELGLDFDDAYQYVVAEDRRLRIVSFDDDFDGTVHGRVEPGHVRR